MTQPLSRSIEQLARGQATRDGAGVNLTRVLTQNLQRRLDPFLMLDEFRSDDPNDYLAGFPDHPHRGFETVTYMLAGQMRHRDSTGREGSIGPGDIQWMTAGRGIVHSEIPEQEQGLMHGFQLWVNLAAEDKLSEPAYREVQSTDIPEYRTAAGNRVRVIAGTVGGVDGAVQRPRTEPLYLHIELAAGSEEFFALPPGHNAFLYAFEGSVKVGDAGQERPLQRSELAVLSNQGEGVRLSSGTGAQLLLLAGQPLREPIAQWGPFVMNTQEQVMQALEDYRSNRL